MTSLIWIIAKKDAVGVISVLTWDTYVCVPFSQLVGIGEKQDSFSALPRRSSLVSSTSGVPAKYRGMPLVTGVFNTSSVDGGICVLVVVAVTTDVRGGELGVESRPALRNVSPNDGRRFKYVSETPTETVLPYKLKCVRWKMESQGINKTHGSSLKSEIAQVRQYIHKALSEGTGDKAGGGTVDQQVLQRIKALETENSNLKKNVKKLEARVNALEKANTGASATSKPAEPDSDYQVAVKTLNTLQTNTQTLDKIRQEKDKNAQLKIPQMWNFAERIGIKEEDVDRLNVIHVSGTKGKGSTCAFCESLLRHHGYKTGLFSSPHLVEVRERFKIDGVDLEREKFVNYFWEVYNMLDKTKEDHEGMMPTYFKFLTVMALHVFLQEKVDVAILEVGIGGQYDCTNMVRHPVVCGVSSLGLDHTSMLGKSIDEIAWHKAGIFKPGVPAFTVRQCQEAMSVLKNRASEIGAPLSVSPDISGYGPDIKLGIWGSVQTLNASLALQLCNTWIQKHKETSASGTTIPEGEDRQTLPSEAYCDIRMAEPFKLTQQHVLGLEQCEWLGRNQTIRENGITFYLDGAHTVESIQQCVEWFLDESKMEKSQSKHGVHVYRVLIFNITGLREASCLMKPLLCCDFDAVLFCPNIAYENNMSADQTSYKVTRETQQKRYIRNKETWEQLLKEQKVEISETNTLCIYRRDQSITNRQSDTETSEADNFSRKDCELNALPSISDCLNWIYRRRQRMHRQNDSASVKHVDGELNRHVVANDYNAERFCDTNMDKDRHECITGIDKVNIGDGDLDNSKDQHVQVLITGSLYLVGGVLRVMQDRQS